MLRLDHHQAVLPRFWRSILQFNIPKTSIIKDQEKLWILQILIYQTLNIAYRNCESRWNIFFHLHLQLPDWYRSMTLDTCLFCAISLLGGRIGSVSFFSREKSSPFWYNCNCPISWSYHGIPQINIDFLWIVSQVDIFDCNTVIEMWIHLKYIQKRRARSIFKKTRLPICKILKSMNLYRGCSSMHFHFIIILFRLFYFFEVRWLKLQRKKIAEFRN